MRHLLVQFKAPEQIDTEREVEKFKTLLDSLSVGYTRINVGLIAIQVPGQEAAYHTAEVLRAVGWWEVVGPLCDEHQTLHTVSAYDRQHGEIWKCFAERCQFMTLPGRAGYMTMQELLHERRRGSLYAGTISGRMSIMGPPASDRKEPQLDAEASEAFKKIWESANYEELEKKLLYLYEQMVRMPKNFREYGTAIKAAEALKNGVPVTFEATSRGTDQLDEAACRARGRDADGGGHFVVQYVPQGHVLPDAVIAMGYALKNRAKYLGHVGRGIEDIRPLYMIDTEADIDKRVVAAMGMKVAQMRTRFEISPPGIVPFTMTRADPEREKIEAVKAQMFGMVPKDATVMDIQIMKAREPDNAKLQRMLEARAQGLADFSRAELLEAAGFDGRYPLGEELRGRFDVDSPPGLRQIPRSELRQRAKSINFSGLDLSGTPMDITPERAREMVDAFLEASEYLAKWLDKTNAKNRAFGYLYGQKDRDVEELRKKVAELTQDVKDRETYVHEIEALYEKRKEELGEAEGGRLANRHALDLALGRERQLKEVVKQSDKLLRMVAGLNLQDHPVSVQKEVREALDQAMKALRGEIPT